MAIWPSDDLTLSLATRKRLRPLIDGYSSRFIDNVKRNSPTAGASQSRDAWGGRTKFTADCPFDLPIDDIELLMSFWDQYRVAGFTFFDFVQKVIGAPGYMPADPLGTGDGSTTTFTARAKEIVASSVIAYNNGVAVAGPTLSVGTGSQGEDRIVFSAAPVGAKTVSGATNASPIVITATGHGRATGDKVTISGVLGNTAANVTLAVIVVINANSFSLTGVAGNGAYTSGGTIAASVLTVAYKGRRRYTVEIPSPPVKGTVPHYQSGIEYQRMSLTVLEKF